MSAATKFCQGVMMQTQRAVHVHLPYADGQSRLICMLPSRNFRHARPSSKRYYGPS